MKKMVLQWLCLLLVAVTSVSCESEPEQGNIVFYTHIQAALNCGEFGVDIMLDNEKMGTLENPFLPLDSVPDCAVIDDGTVLSLDLPEGDYQFIAIGNCGTNLRDTVSISVGSSECSAVEILEIESVRQPKSKENIEQITKADR